MAEKKTIKENGVLYVLGAVMLEFPEQAFQICGCHCEASCHVRDVDYTQHVYTKRLKEVRSQQCQQTDVQSSPLVL